MYRIDRLPLGEDVPSVIEASMVCKWDARFKATESLEISICFSLVRQFLLEKNKNCPIDLRNSQRPVRQRFAGNKAIY
jgi:hypothetical protein